MSRPRVGATARVAVTIEIACPSTWGNDCSLEQVHKQAKNDALGILGRLRRGEEAMPLTFVRPMEVTTVIVSEAKP